MVWLCRQNHLWGSYDPWKQRITLGGIHIDEGFPRTALITSIAVGDRQSSRRKWQYYWVEDSEVGVWGSHRSLKLERRESQKGGSLRGGAFKPIWRLPANPQLTPGLCMCRGGTKSPTERRGWKSSCLVLRDGSEFNSLPSERGVVNA